MMLFGMALWMIFGYQKYIKLDVESLATWVASAFRLHLSLQSHQTPQPPLIMYWRSELSPERWKKSGVETICPGNIGGGQFLQSINLNRNQPKYTNNSQTQLHGQDQSRLGQPQDSAEKTPSIN